MPLSPLQPLTPDTLAPAAATLQAPLYPAADLYPGADTFPSQGRRLTLTEVDIDEL